MPVVVVLLTLTVIIVIVVLLIFYRYLVSYVVTIVTQKFDFLKWSHSVKCFPIFLHVHAL